MISTFFKPFLKEVISKIGVHGYMSDEQKVAITKDINDVAIRFEQELTEAYKTELITRTEIIKAEMQQGDNFTKRARPAVVYLFIATIILNYTILPAIAQFLQIAGFTLVLPEEAWNAFEIVFGVYAVGRTFEKSSGVDKISSAITKTKDAYKNK